MRVELEGVGVTRGGTRILSDVSLAVGEGSFTSVLGTSGAGKSTLLGVVSGLVCQDEGSVLIDGAPVDDLAPERRGVAVVFQDARLFPNMDVRDNVAFPLRVRGVGRRQRREAAEEMLGRVQLEGLGGRRVGELSGGQRQRVALARALVAAPRVVLLDEPFSGLDEALRGDMRRLVSSLHEELGITALMVTHDPLEALTMSDEVVYLAEGRVAQAGSPADVLMRPASPAVAACFGRTSALEGTAAQGEFACGKLRVPAPGVADGPAVLLRTSDGAVHVHAMGEA